MDRLLAAALHDAARRAEVPARLVQAVCAAVAEQPKARSRRSLSARLSGLLLAFVLSDEEQRPLPMIVHQVSFVDLGNVTPGLTWWSLGRGARQPLTRLCD